MHAEKNCSGWVGGCDFAHILSQSKNGFDCLNKTPQPTQVSIAEDECTLIFHIFWFCHLVGFTVNFQVAEAFLKFLLLEYILKALKFLFLLCTKRNMKMKTKCIHIGKAMQLVAVEKAVVQLVLCNSSWCGDSYPEEKCLS